MHNIGGILILFFYTCALVSLGFLVVRHFLKQFPAIFMVVSAFLLGVGVGVPLTYGFSCLFSFFTREPMLWGVITVTFLSYGTMGYTLWKHNVRIGQKIICVSDSVLVLFSLSFSAWLMMKTFRGGGDGQLFVGSNNVFDFGLLVGLVRSISEGANIPITSPFFGGMPFFYHFFFQFWASLWEYFGVPLMWAINIPSILSFSALLITIYYIPQIIGKQKKIIGWIAVILTITHSTLTFWILLFQKGFSVQFLKDLWRLPTYPFAGPFDGSTISLYATLNNFVNQRHLAFAIAYGLVIILMCWQVCTEKKRPLNRFLLLGICTGMSFLWNMPVFFLVGFINSFFLISKKLWKELFLYGFVSVITMSVTLFQLFPVWRDMYAIITQMIHGTYGTAPLMSPHWTIGEYLFLNMGMLPLVSVGGFMILPKVKRMFFIPFVILFLLECSIAGIGHRGFDQKFYAFLIIGMNLLAAVSISWIWEKRSIVFRIMACVLLFILSVSGAVDLIAVKNEFAFPFVSKEMIPVISWIMKETPKQALFVSYADIIDPVVVSGRKNYFGFFGNIGWEDRSSIVKNIYAGDIHTAASLGISYILIPTWNKNDFPYTPDMMYFQEHRMIVYQDRLFTVVEVKQ